MQNVLLLCSPLGPWVLEAEDCCSPAPNSSGSLGVWAFHTVLGDVRDLGLINYTLFKLTLEKWEIDFFWRNNILEIRDIKMGFDLSYQGSYHRDD